MGTIIKYNGNTIANFDPNTGSKYLRCNGNVMATDVEIETNIEVYDGSLLLPRVGGRIFYVDTTSTGGTYTFYKQDMTPITTSNPPTVAELADAYYYSVSGTPSKDMFYVYDNTNGLITGKEWGAFNANVGVTNDGIGVGKTNSTTALANSACFVPDTSGNTTIWKWLRDEINANNIGGCNDWFIASKAEQDKLRESGLVTWFSDKYIWSSVEYSSAFSWYWYPSISGWRNFNKSFTVSVFASRAF